jgi:myosin-crossreactive antigen
LAIPPLPRYMNRFLYLFGHLSDITGVMPTPINQHQALIEPLVAWLRPRGVNFLTGAFVQEVDFAPSSGPMTVNRLDYTRDGRMTSVAVAPAPREIAFTIECSVRSAWQAIYVLLKRRPAPMPVYQGQYDPKALFNALKVFVCG